LICLLGLLLLLLDGNMCQLCLPGTSVAIILRCCHIRTAHLTVQVMLFKSETGRSRVAHVSMRDMKVWI